MNHSADIDYKDFMKIYRKCTSELYSFLTIDTTLPADNSFRFRKKSFRSIIKMTLTDELKILDGKLKASQAQYDLVRKAAKISALSCKVLDKYEYLTGGDLGYKPGVVEQAKFEYTPLGKVFDKGLDECDKKEGLLKRLKNEEQLKVIKDQEERQLDPINDWEKKKSKTIKKDSKTNVIVYLREGIDKLFRICPKSFDAKSKVALEKLKLKVNEIDYKNLSYKFYFSEEDRVVSHKINFLRKYGILCGLLVDLVTRKININNGNIDKLNIRINLMHDYNKNDFFDKEIQIQKSSSLKNEVLTKAGIVFTMQK